MDKVIRIDLSRCFWELLKKSYIIILCGILFAGMGYVATANKKDVFVANTSIYSASYGNYTESMQSINIVQTYIDIVNSRKVSERASMLIDEAVSSAEISGMISASYEEDSAILWIRARSYDPEKAIMVANAVAESMIIEVQNITGNSAIQILDLANSAGIAASTSTFKICLIAFLIGMFIPMIIIVLRETLSDRVYRVIDAELNGSIEIIGIIPVNDKL